MSEKRASNLKFATKNSKKGVQNTHKKGVAREGREGDGGRVERMRKTVK